MKSQKNLQKKGEYKFSSHHHLKIKIAAAALIGTFVIGMLPRSSKSSKKPLDGTIFEDTYVVTMEDGEKHIVAIALSNGSGRVYYDVLTNEYFLDSSSSSISVDDSTIIVHDVKECVPLASLLTSSELEDSTTIGLNQEQLKIVVDRVTTPDVKLEDKTRVRN